jgi:hypothetical protein
MVFLFFQSKPLTYKQRGMTVPAVFSIQHEKKLKTLQNLKKNPRIARGSFEYANDPKD